jgi:hypothetical protein
MNNTMIDESRLKVSESMSERALRRYRTAEVQTKMKETGEIRSNIDDDRKLNRQSIKRWEGTLNRGYNIVNTTTTKDLPLPRPMPAPSVWSRLQDTMTSSNASLPLASTDFSSTGFKCGQFAESIADSALNEGLITKVSLPCSAPLDGDRISKNLSGSEIRETAMSSRQWIQNSSSNQLSTSSPVVSARQVLSQSSSRSTQKQLLIPSIDLSKTEPPQIVSYSEPPILSSKSNKNPMIIVRTGGFSGL